MALLMRAVLVAAAAWGETPVERWGALKVSGTRLVSTVTQEAVQLVGVSLFASNTGWHGDSFWNEDVVASLATWPGLSLLRAPIGVETVGGYLEDPSNAEKLKVVVDAAIKAGIYVVIDWHAFTAELYLDDAKAFFRDMVALYGDKPNVLYEIFNEPKPPDETGKRDWKSLRNYALALLSVIRKKSTSPVVMGTPFFSQYLPDVARHPVNEFPNVLYSLHFYASYAGHAVLQTYLEQYSQTIPIFVSEWGSACPHYDCPVVPSLVENWMALLDNHNVSWAHWALNDQASDDEHILANTMSMLLPGADKHGAWNDSSYTRSGLMTRALLARHAPGASPLRGDGASAVAAAFGGDATTPIAATSANVAPKGDGAIAPLPAELQLQQQNSNKKKGQNT